MEEQKYCLLEICEDIEGEEHIEYYGFKTKEKAELFKEDYDKNSRYEDGFYYAGIDNIHYNFDELTKSEIKDVLSGNACDELFGHEEKLKVIDIWLRQEAENITKECEKIESAIVKKVNTGKFKDIQYLQIKRDELIAQEMKLYEMLGRKDELKF